MRIVVHCSYVPASSKMFIKMHIPRLGGGKTPHHDWSMRIYILFYFIAAVQLLSRDPLDYRMPGFSVLHYLLEFAQTHVQFIFFPVVLRYN